jgi:putative aldouronate transport system permease protein
MLTQSRGDRWFGLINNFILAIISLAVLYPLVFMISASISDPVLINSGRIWLWPRGIQFDGYERIFSYPHIWIGYRNTIFYTLLGTFINLVVTLTCAYSLSRKDLVGRNTIMFLFVLTMFFSGGLIPTFLVVKQLGLVNTIWAMVIPNAASMWNIIITRSFMQMNIPNELQESAMIDGASNMRQFISIVLPLSKPIMAAMGLFYAVGHWNAYFNALVYLTDRDLFPLQLVLRQILVLNQVTDLLTMTADELENLDKQMHMAEMMKYGLIIIATLPILIVYPFLQKYFVKGVLIGSVKG